MPRPTKLISAVTSWAVGAEYTPEGDDPENTSDDATVFGGENSGSGNENPVAGNENADPLLIDWSTVPLDDPRWDLMDDIEIDDDEVSAGPPDPATRSWRHPSEVAAANAHMNRFLAEEAQNSHPSSLGSAVTSSTPNRVLMAVAAGAVVVAGVSVWQGNRETLSTETASVFTATSIAASSTEQSAEPDYSLPALEADPVATVAAEQSETSGSGFFAVVKETVEAPPAWAFEVLDGEDDLTSSTLATALSVDGLSPEFLITSADALGSRTQVTLAHHAASNLAPGSNRPSLATAKVVGSDPASDIAVLRMEAASSGSTGSIGLPAQQGSRVRVRTGTPSKTHSGAVLLITPEGMETSAPVPGGHLGAAVVNGRGTLVGIVVNGSSMLATAIPAEEARRIAVNIAEYGYANPNWLGLTVSGETGYIEVVDVAEGGPADLGGLVVGDRILGAGDSRIIVTDQLLDIVATQAPGSELAVVVQRDNDQVESLPITVGQRPKADLATSWVDT